MEIFAVIIIVYGIHLADKWLDNRSMERFIKRMRRKTARD